MHFRSRAHANVNRILIDSLSICQWFVEQRRNDVIISPRAPPGQRGPHFHGEVLCRSSWQAYLDRRHVWRLAGMQSEAACIEYGVGTEKEGLIAMYSDSVVGYFFLWIAR